MFKNNDDADTTAEQSLAWLGIVAIGAAEFGDDREFNKWNPLLEAYAAGAFSFFFTERGIEVCTIPSLVKVDDQHRLHSESGPAFEWLEARDFYWHGVRVERQVVENPENITVAEIEAEPEAEVRQIKIERMGQTQTKGEILKISSVTTDELKERFIRACDLKQTVNWDKIAGYFRRWAAGCKIETSSIVRIETAAQLKKAELAAWAAAAARQLSSANSATAIQRADGQAIPRRSPAERARDAERSASSLRHLLSREGGPTGDSGMAKMIKVYDRIAADARRQMASEAPTALSMAKEVCTRKIVPAIMAAQTLWIADIEWNGTKLSNRPTGSIGRNATALSLIAIEALEYTDPGTKFSNCYQIFKAFEAGAFRFFITKDSIEVCAIPTVVNLDEQGRLHAASGPAFVWLDDIRVFSWHGVRVEDYVIEHPERITVADIETERNAEVRRVKIERYGLARYLADSGAREIHRDDYGVLYRREVPDEEPLVVVKVLNATPEADGSFKDYFLRVPPAMKTAREAVAWTFGKTSDDYGPEQET
jgi:hypothetical protein